MAATGARPGSLQMRNAAAGALVVDDQPVPVDGRGNLLLRYRGPKNAFPYVSAVDVLRGGPSAQALRDTLVFVGATALGVKDVVITPLDTLVAGVEVHATVADNLLRRNSCRDRTTRGCSRQRRSCARDRVTLSASGAAWPRRPPVVRVPRFHLGCHVLGVLVWTRLRLTGSADARRVLAFAAAAPPRTRASTARAERASVDLQRSAAAVIQSLLSLTETRDADTGRHSRRTQTFARLLAEQLSTHPRFRDT